MGHLRQPLLTKFFFGFLSTESALFAECAALLGSRYGVIDLESESAAWDISDYYREEMGSPLFRKFIFFRELQDPGCLPDAKLLSIRIEEQFSRNEAGGLRRRINIDPGYVTEAKVVLATTKDFSHRVFIGSGIYAEVALRFNSRERSFSSLEHTYYDFRSAEYRALFNKARDMLREGLSRRV